MRHTALSGCNIVATAFIQIPRQRKYFPEGLHQFEAEEEKKKEKKDFFSAFTECLFTQTQFLPIMTKFISWQRHHIHQTSIIQPVHRCTELNKGGGRKTIMFLSCKLCLLIALLLGWLLMDITFHAIPQAAVWSSPFWNERLCDAPLKLVQRGIIHHLRRCQRGAAASPCLPVTMGLQAEAPSATSQCCALHPATMIAPPPRFPSIWNNHGSSYSRSYFKGPPPCIHPVLTQKDLQQKFLLRM